MLIIQPITNDQNMYDLMINNLYNQTIKAS